MSAALGIGRVSNGTLKTGGLYTLCRTDGSRVPSKVTQLFGWHGLKRIKLDAAEAGAIVAVAGIKDINIGDTIADIEKPQPLPTIRIDEPTITMIFCVNTSPWAGREGDYVTSRNYGNASCWSSIGNVSLRIEDTDSSDAFRITGRGELQLAILIETMRREGYELAVSKPAVVTHQVNQAIHEPMELLVIDIPKTYVGVVTQLLGVRRGQMMKMVHLGSGRRPPRLLRPFARVDRLSLSLSHRHTWDRSYEYVIRWLGTMARADPGPHQWCHRAA